MAETESAEFEMRLAALEKSVRELSGIVELRTRGLTEIQADARSGMDNSVRVVAMLEEVLPLVRKAAPLLDSPMAKLAHSPAAGIMSVFSGGRRG